MQHKKLHTKKSNRLSHDRSGWHYCEFFDNAQPVSTIARGACCKFVRGYVPYIRVIASDTVVYSLSKEQREEYFNMKRQGLNPVILHTMPSNPKQYYILVEGRRKVNWVIKDSIQFNKTKGKKIMNTKSTRTKDQIIESQRDEIFAMAKENGSLKQQLKDAAKFADQQTEEIRRHSMATEKLIKRVNELENAAVSDAMRVLASPEVREEIEKAEGAVNNANITINKLSQKNEELTRLYESTLENSHSLERNNERLNKTIAEQRDIIHNLESYKGTKIDHEIVQKAQHQVKKVENANINLQGDLSELGSKYNELKSHSTTHQVAIGVIGNLVSGSQNKNLTSD